MISKEELKYMYIDKKMSQEEISHKFNVTRGTIGNWMIKYNIDRRNHSESKLLKSLITAMLSKEELVYMYVNKKMSLPEISNEIGVGISTVNRWMQKYRIETRTISESNLGEKNGRWNGGISNFPYCYKFNNKFKEAVRLRDDCTCQLCGFKQIQGVRKLSIHHIHYDKENCYPDVVALCHSCHSTVNSNRDEWEKCFEDDLSRRGLLNWSS